MTTVDNTTPPVVRTTRAAGIAMRQGHVLLHRAEIDEFYTLPGGSIEALEHAESALIREMHEELNTAVQVGRLCFIVENFFRYRDVAYHEIGFYFAMQFPPDSPLNRLDQPFDGVEVYFAPHPGELRLIFEWVPLTSLGQVDLKPAFLQQALPELDDPGSSTAIRHLVIDEFGFSR